MANKRITDLDEKVNVIDNDWVEIVDTEDTTDSPEGSSKKAKKENIIKGLVEKTGTPSNTEIAVWDSDGVIKGDDNFTWDGNVLSIQETENTQGAAIKIGDNGRDDGTYGQGVTTAMTHRSVDFNAFGDRSIVNPTILEAKGYGSFDTSVIMQGNNPVNHLYGYQARNTWDSPTTLPTTSIFNSLTGYMAGLNVEQGTVPNAVGYLAFNINGGGTVQNQYAMYMTAQTKGTVSNWGLYSLNNNYLEKIRI